MGTLWAWGPLSPEAASPLPLLLMLRTEQVLPRQPAVSCASDPRLNQPIRRLLGEAPARMPIVSFDFVISSAMGRDPVTGSSFHLFILNEVYGIVGLRRRGRWAQCYASAIVRHRYLQFRSKRRLARGWR